LDLPDGGRADGSAKQTEQGDGGMVASRVLSSALLQSDRTSGHGDIQRERGSGLAADRGAMADTGGIKVGMLHIRIDRVVARESDMRIGGGGREWESESDACSSQEGCRADRGRRDGLGEWIGEVDKSGDSVGGGKGERGGGFVEDGGEGFGRGGYGFVCGSGEEKTGGDEGGWGDDRGSG